jgi:hypothetical protein
MHLRSMVSTVPALVINVAKVDCSFSRTCSITTTDNSIVVIKSVKQDHRITYKQLIEKNIITFHQFDFEVLECRFVVNR